MRDDFDDFDDDRPLNAEERAEYLAVMRHAEVSTLKDRAKETALMFSRAAPVPTLDDAKLSELSTDVQVRQQQLLMLWSLERTLRRRCQDSLRTALEMIAG